MADLPTDSPTVSAIYRHHESKADDGHRPHLGGSLIGHDCDRHLWYTFRWALSREFNGRMLRLFETGQLEEDRFVAELRAIGVTVWEVDPDTGSQFRVSVGGHFSGSLDGVGLGIENSSKPHVLEFKTHNAKSFADLKKHGVEKSKPMHYAQMQIYGYLMDIERALYLAKNKDTDELYSERIVIKKTEAKRLVDRAERIIYSDRAPARMSEDAAFYKCKWCDHHAICHGYKPPEVNCRTCAFSTPKEDDRGRGYWFCEHHSKTLHDQAGCDLHLYNPEFIRIPVKEFDPASHTMTYENGLRNGPVPSTEIAKADDVRLIDGNVSDLMTEMGATIDED